MTSMSLAAVFWLGLHLIVAGPLRSPLVDKLGERPFRSIFSLLSVAGLGWFIVAYRMAPLVPLWQGRRNAGSSGKRHDNTGHSPNPTQHPRQRLPLHRNSPRRIAMLQCANPPLTQRRCS